MDPAISTALIVLGALNLALSSASLFQSHRALQSCAQVMAAIRQARKR